MVGEILTTGNTVIDALLLMARSAPDWDLPGLDWQGQRVLLATVHRRENWGSRLLEIGRGFLDVLERFPDTALLLPLHRNPTVREPLQALLGSHPRAFLIEPLDYDRLVAAMRGSTLLLTDSGGLQEEAPALGKPVLVLRRTTERPEAVTAGTAKLIGTDSEAILAETSRLLEDPEAYEGHGPGPQSLRRRRGQRPDRGRGAPVSRGGRCRGPLRRRPRPGGQGPRQRLTRWLSGASSPRGAGRRTPWCRSPGPRGSGCPCRCWPPVPPAGRWAPGPCPPAAPRGGRPR